SRPGVPRREEAGPRLENHGGEAQKRRMDQAVPASTAEPSGLGELFSAFLSIALSGFGGVLPWARRMLVEKKGWLTDEAFTETLSLCQSLPGPNIVNVSIVVGSRFAGAKGAVAALSGLVAAPMLIVIVLAALYDRFGGVERLQGAIVGIAAAAAGLVVATAAKLAEPLLKRRPLRATPFIALAFVGVGILRFPLPWVLLALAPLSVAAVWRRPS
ncbi:MAG TPA: chromate transporter, partial [Caulobacteraceae bacterium]|nr:chromate transporter [Caulobacteraceae bacterium]